MEMKVYELFIRHALGSSQRSGISLVKLLGSTRNITRPRRPARRSDPVLFYNSIAWRDRGG
jgi:hypothetical protein